MRYRLPYALQIQHQLLRLMKAIFYPLLASKLLNHCQVYLDTMKTMENEELVEQGFNEFVSNSDRVIQYLEKEIRMIGGAAPNWFKNKRDRLPLRLLFYSLRHIVTHHYIIPLTPIFYINGDNVKPENLQLEEMRLDIQKLPKDKDFDKKRMQFITEFGESVDAVKLSARYLKSLTLMVQEAEALYGNNKHFRRQKLKSSIRVNPDLTLRHFERTL